MTQDHEAGRMLGPYVIVETVGAGSTGTVLRARCSRTHIDVALKVIHGFSSQRKDERARLRREAEIQSRLDHPRIARIHEFQESADPLYFVMEYVPGDSLAGRFEERDIRPLELVGIALQVLEGLEAAWISGGIVHRDVKPSNIRITQAGDVKLVDFGLARSVTDDLASTLTGSGMILGTPSYMPPEQALGKPLDFRSDLYSLGVLLYEGVTGTLPFRGRNAVEVILKHRDECPTPPEQLRPGTPVVLSETLMRLLAKDPAARFQSFESLREALTSCQVELAKVPPETWNRSTIVPDQASTRSKATVLLLATTAAGAKRSRGRRVAQLLTVPLLLALGTCPGFRSDPSTSGPDVAAVAPESPSIELDMTLPPVDRPPGAGAPDPTNQSAGRSPCGFELRGIPCPFEQPYSPEVAEARARAIRSRPWRPFPEVLSGALRHLATLDENSRKSATLSELDVELRSRVNALAYVKLAAPLGSAALQIYPELVKLCRELSAEMKRDSKRGTDRLDAMKARVVALPPADRELFDEVMFYGNVPDRLQKGPGMRNKGGFVEMATIQTPTQPGMFEVSIRPVR